MRPESEPSGSPPLPTPERAGEQEVDFGRYLRAIAARWWLVGAAVAVGVVVGYLVSLGGGDVFRATATIYLGQPLTPASSSQIQSIQTNPSVVRQIVRSTSVVRQVAAEVGVPAGKLRSGISTKAVEGAVARLGQTQLVEIAVRGPWRAESAQAANRLAETALGIVSRYPDAKIASLEKQLADQERELVAIEESVAQYNASLEDASLSGAERLAVVGLVQNAEERRGQLSTERTETELALTVARDVESGQLVTRAAPAKVAARSRTSSIVVGGVIGLLAGAVLAVLWVPLVERARPRAPGV